MFNGPVLSSKIPHETKIMHHFSEFFLEDKKQKKKKKKKKKKRNRFHVNNSNKRFLETKKFRTLFPSFFSKTKKKEIDFMSIIQTKFP